MAVIDERTIKDKIYTVRGFRVMLDFEIAEIYGYETKRFNQQISRNLDKFPADFRFRLTREEMDDLLRSHFVTSSWGGNRYLPWAFTESGIYMVMTVLKGEIATKQSIALIRTFQAIKDYIVDTQGLVTQRDLLRLSVQTAENTEAIRKIQSTVMDQQQIISAQQALVLEHDDKLVDAFERINETVRKSDISPVLLNFDLTGPSQNEFLLLHGKPVKADVTYMSIYSRAKHSIYIVDNYISIKTIHLLQDVRPGVSVTIFSDNVGNYLHKSDVEDFFVEFPMTEISFIKSAHTMHDRFIFLDYGEKEERVYHCGASSKDAAVKLTTVITEVTSDVIREALHEMIEKMKSNEHLFNCM